MDDVELRREHDLEVSPSSAVPTWEPSAVAVPGKIARSASLVGPGRGLESGLVRRKTDGNGVREDAAAAVDAASRSTGSPLPALLQRKFEGALGVDLGQVRVHTGESSVEAARATGANAYTLGQDIHFNAGRYDPTSAAGEELLAHEVAHTVQQGGGAPAAPMFQLEVSTPGDAHEVEADHAAKAMVAGRTVAVTGVSRSLARDYTSAADKAADEAAREEAKRPDSVGAITDVKDRAAAQRVLAQIRGARDDLKMDSDVPAAYVTKNETAINELEVYLDCLGGQEVATGNFKLLYKRARVEYARLDAMAQKAGGMGINEKNEQVAEEIRGDASGPPTTRMKRSGGEVVGEQTGKDLARDHVAIGAGDTVEHLAERAGAVAARNPLIKAQLANLQKDKDALKPQSDAVLGAERETTNAVTAIASANNAIAATGARLSSEGAKSAFEAANAKVEANRALVTSIAGSMAEIATGGLTNVATGKASGVGDEVQKKAVGAVNDLIAKLIGNVNGLPGLSLAEADKQKLQESQVQAEVAAIKTYESQRQALLAAATNAKVKSTAMLTQLSLLDQKKQAHRTALVTLGAQLDAAEAAASGAPRKKLGEMGPFQTITTFVAEADIFLTESDTAIKAGEQENATDGAFDQAKFARAHVNDVFYYIGQPVWAPGEKMRMRAVPITVHLSQEPGFRKPGEEDVARGRDSMEDDDGGGVSGGRTAILKAIEALRKYKTEIQGYRDELGRSLGVE